MNYSKPRVLAYLLRITIQLGISQGWHYKCIEDSYRNMTHLQFLLIFILERECDLSWKMDLKH